MENTKNTKLLVGLGVVLAIIIVVWLANKNSDSETQNNQAVEQTEDTSAGSINAQSASTMSYADAIAKYSGAILGLDESCKAIPAKMTFKNNGTLMIDNRSSLDRVVKVGSTMNLKANSFKIVPIQSQTLPATLSVDCDQTQAVASIVVE